MATLTVATIPESSANDVQARIHQHERMFKSGITSIGV